MNALRYALCSLLIAACGFAGRSYAADYPSRPIRFVVPAPPAGPTDIMARLIAEKLAAAWKQPIVIDNRAGGSGVIGTDAVVKAPPDGYTVLVQVAGMLITPYLFQKLPYDIFRDLTPVSLLASTSVIFVVNASVPAKTLGDFVKLAKAKPRHLSYASPGTGSSAHLFGETLNLEAGLDLLHVPYKGEAAAVSDLLGGNISSAFISAAVYAPYARSGKLKALASTSNTRLPMLPNVPTFAELGYRGFEPTGWFGLLMPAGTPKAIVDQFAAEVSRIVRDPQVASRLAELGYLALGTTPEEFAKTMKADYATWGVYIRRTGIQVD